MSLTTSANPDTFLASIPPPAAIGTEARVCEDIAARQRLGIAKYGTTVEDNPLPLDKWLKHAYEEALDMAVYLRRSTEEKTVLQRKLEAREEDLTYAYGRIRELEHERDTLIAAIETHRAKLPFPPDFCDTELYSAIPTTAP